MRKRFDIRKILADPVLRKKFMLPGILFIRNIEGANRTMEQIEEAYDKVQKEKLFTRS